MMYRPTIWLLCVAVGSAFAIAAEASSVSESDAQRFQPLIGRDNFLREVARFKTEKGEDAAIVLYAAGASRYEQTEILSCDGEVGGRVGMVGDYFLALFVNDTPINRLELGRRALPLETDHLLNRFFWGEPGYPEGDPRNSQVEPVTLLRLADYNGDGTAWELRMVRREVCGHDSTELFGYSARQRRLIQYAIISGDERVLEHDNLFPNPAHIGKDGRLHYAFVCGDHGNDRQVSRDFTYDSGKEAWVRTRDESRQCGAIGGRAAHPEVIYYFRRADVAPGSNGAVEMELRSRSRATVTFDVEIVFDPPIRVERTKDGKPDCVSLDAGGGENESALFRVIDICSQSEPGTTCQPKDAVATSVHAALEVDDDVKVLRCRFVAPAGTPYGHYPVWAHRVRAVDANGAALQVDGLEGLIHVDPSP